MIGMYAPYACAGTFFLLKLDILGLTPLSSDTKALRKSYLKLGLQFVR